MLGGAVASYSLIGTAKFKALDPEAYKCAH